MEVMEAVAPVFPEAVGIRIAPHTRLKGGNNPPGGDIVETFSLLVDGIMASPCAYLTIVGAAPFDEAELRFRFKGRVYIANGGYTPASAEKAIASGFADLASFASLFRDNPNLPQCLATGRPLLDGHTPVDSARAPAAY